jgi:uncharacterized membrane protein (UPF0182 family)
LIIVIALAGGYLLFTELWTRKLWFDSLDFTGVFTTVLGTQVLLFAAFFAAMTLIVGVNVIIAMRSGRKKAKRGPNPLLDRYRELLDKYRIWVGLIPAAVFGIVTGWNATAQSMMYLSWWNRRPFGTVDQYFGMDASFYVFELPVWRDLLSFAQSALLLSLAAAAVVHLVLGSIDFGQAQIVGGQVVFARSKGPRTSSPLPRIQLSILGGLWLVGMGCQLLLSRYSLLNENGTLFTGMHYTDFNSRLVAYQVMAVISFICAALFFANVFIKRLMLPLAGVVLMLVSGLILSMIYPAVIQNFEVMPNEPDKESAFIQKHVAATRESFAIEEVEIENYTAVSEVNAGQLKNDAAALPGVRLIDPAVVSQTFEQLQQVKGYYKVADELDVDRYVIDGQETDAVVAAREIKLAGLPDQQWNNIHTVYTHGNGLIAAYGNRRQTGGSPVWIEKDIPSTGELGEYEGRIYFGEDSSQYVIVGREPDPETGEIQPIELDTPGGSEAGGETYNVYEGTGGVPIGDWFTQLLYATHFMDINILLSDRVVSVSKILYDRTPTERVEQVAPWLTLDQNIYPAVVDKRLVWIVDCYTTSDLYPNSELVTLTESTDRLLPSTRVNYMRNSVKAVVDAADGSVVLYAWEPDDPILATYAAAFPGSVTPREEISDDLMAHLRYPNDLFNVQRQLLSRYHMTDPKQWYQQSDLWEIPDDPISTETPKPLEPAYYLSIKWPKTSAPIFSETAVYVPKGRQNLAAYLSVIAEATSPDYGKLRVLVMSNTRQIDGPGQTFNAMTTDAQVAEVLRSFLFQGSAEAIYGNLLTLPMGNGLLYVMPIYAQRQASTGSYPALNYVVVRFGEHVSIGQTLQEALDKVFQGDAGADTGEQPVASDTTQPTQPDNPATPAPTPTATSTTPATPIPTATSTIPADPQSAAAESLKKAEEAFTAADAALREGDLGTYQAKVAEARDELSKALELLGVK